MLLLWLFCGGFLMLPLGHRVMVARASAHELAGGHGSCAAPDRACDAEDTAPGNTHDPQACRLCRVAALPLLAGVAPAVAGLPAFYPATVHPTPLLFTMRYEGFSFSARAPPLPG